MSTIRANNFQGLDAANPAIELPADGTLIVASGFSGDLESKGVFVASGLTVESTATFAVGASGTPAIAASGDLNTGIYFPAADTIGFAEGGNETARIDSSGRLLVGTTTASISGVSKLFQVVDSAGASIGLGRTSGSPISNGEVLGGIDFLGAGLAPGAYIRCVANGEQSSTADLPSDLTFATTPNSSSTNVERLRITRDGEARFFAPGVTLLAARNTASAGTSVTNFAGIHSSTTNSDGTVSFRVYTNGNVQNTNDSYGVLSDIKLKENIVDAESQWDDFKAVRFRKFNFKEETGHETFTQLGVIAQELELVSPGLVYELPDLDEEGNDLGTTTKAVKSSVLVKKALVALQEAMERIETLQTANASLEARLTALEGA